MWARYGLYFQLPDPLASSTLPRLVVSSAGYKRRLLSSCGGWPSRRPPSPPHILPCIVKHCHTHTHGCSGGPSPCWPPAGGMAGVCSLSSQGTRGVLVPRSTETRGQVAVTPRVLRKALCSPAPSPLSLTVVAFPSVLKEAI